MHFSMVLLQMFCLGGSTSLPPWAVIRGLSEVDVLPLAPALPWA